MSPSISNRGVRVIALCVSLAATDCATRGPEVAVPVLPPAAAPGPWIAARPRWTFDLPPMGGQMPPGWSFQPKPGGTPGNMSCSCPGVVTAPALSDDRSAPSLGGSYWKTPFQAKAQGCCRVTTGGRESVGILRTPLFRPFARYVHLRVSIDPASGASGPSGASRVELHAQEREDPLFVETIATDAPREVAIVWDLDRIDPPLDPRAPVRIRVIDESGAATIGVADVIASDDARPVASTPLWGIADLHAHFFSDMGFGGSLFHGRVHSSLSGDGSLLSMARSDPSKALSGCRIEHGGDEGSDRTTVLNGDWNHGHGGPPDYAGWPRFDVVLEQQTYIDWIKRAARGGVRLVNVDVLNSVPISELFFTSGGQAFGGLLERQFSTPSSATDTWNLERQTRALRRLVSLADVSEWAAVATSARQARDIIGRGKVAFVPGTEVDDLGELTQQLAGLRYESQIRPLVRSYVLHMNTIGIRHVFPTHLTNNGLGGTAIYSGLFAGASFYMQHEHFGLVSGEAEGVFYRLDHDKPEALVLLAAGSKARRDVLRPFSTLEQSWAGHRNADGLSRAGWILVEELARAGMLIDLDHMSERATEEALCFGETIGYPVMFSHTGFRSLGFVPQRPLESGAKRSDETSNPAHFASERARTSKQIQRARSLGGVVGVGTGKAVLQSSRWRPTFAPELARRLDELECDGSSVTFARQYLYALEAAGGQGVALGTDVNGFSDQLAPRFGPFACAGVRDRKRGSIDDAERERQAGAQVARVVYGAACKNEDGADRRCPMRRDARRFADVRGAERTMHPTAWRALWMFESGEAADLASRCEDLPGRATPTEAGAAADVDARDLALGLLTSSTDATFRPRCSSAAESMCTQRVSYLAARIGPKECRRACASLPSECNKGDLCVGTCEEMSLVYSNWFERGKGGLPEPIQKSVLGRADFDFNVDGLAHYGLIPDMLQDLRNIGLTEEHLAPLFHSVEDYVRMWEIAEARAASLRELDPQGVGRISMPGLTAADWARCGRPPLP